MQKKLPGRQKKAPGFHIAAFLKSKKQSDEILCVFRVQALSSDTCGS